MPNILAKIFVRTALVSVFAISGLAAATEGSAPRMTEEEACKKAADILEAFSPSRPDVGNLVTLFQLRDAFADVKIRSFLDNLEAIGFVAAHRPDIYAKRMRPLLQDPVRLEGEGQVDCKACRGEGWYKVRCGLCEGKGQCPTCKGAGKKRVNVSIRSFRGPTAAHAKPQDEFQEIPCTVCRGSGSCKECAGEGMKKGLCQSCGGTGKTWDAVAVNRLALEAYEALRAAIKIKMFEASIPASIVTATADGQRYFAPVFRFGDHCVAALSARAATCVSSLSLYTADKRPVPFSALLVASNRDLVLIDLAESSIVPPLPLEDDMSRLDTDSPVYAYGTSRENGMGVRLDGKIVTAGPLHLFTTVETQTLADCAPLITDGGKLGGLFMFPVADFNAMGAVSLAEKQGVALRLDNLLPPDFSRLSVDALRARNNILLFARRAIQAAKDLLDCDDSEFALRKTTVSETVKRLDRAVAMIKGVQSWDVFMMEATARELAGDAKARAGNLESRLAKIAEKEAGRGKRAVSGNESGTNAVATVTPAPEKPVESAPRKTSAAAKDEKGDGLRHACNWKITLVVVAVVIVVITAIFILIGVVQDVRRRKKLSAPPEIPDFIREMKEYERRHPEKGR